MKSAVEKRSLRIKSSRGVGGRCLVRPIWILLPSCWYCRPA